MIKLNIQYFGMIAEKTGMSEEILKSSSCTVKELLEELENKHAQIKGLTFKIAMNNKIVQENQTIENNSTIAIMPPFAGG